MLKYSTQVRLRAALIATTALALSPTGFAQGNNEEPTEEELREETVTVYATSNPIAVFDYPGQVTVLDRSDLDELVPSTISDALRDVPGVDFAGGPRRTGELPSIRGLSGQNVLILLDGARQSFTSAHDGRFFVDPELLGSVEVVRGPASALYGSGAVGGVLALESVDAADLLGDDETFGARVRLGYQDVNEETVASVTAYTNTGGFDGVASFGGRKSGDIELGSGATLPSEDDIQTILLKGNYTLTDALTVEASWQRFANTAIEPNNGQGVAVSSDPVLGRDVEKDITTDTYRIGLDFDPQNNDLIDFNLTAYRTESAVDEFDVTLPRTTVRDIETTGFSARNASRFDLGGIETTLTIGADYFEDTQVGTDDQSVDGTRNGVPDGESAFTGLFAQLEAVIDTPVGEFLVIPGIRYDEFENSSSAALAEDNSDNATSPRLAASFQPEAASWLRIFGSYSEGFRAPSINELYLNGLHFNVPHPVLFNPAMGQFVFAPNNFVPNPNLVPESTETVEFGFGTDFSNVFASGDRVQAKVSYYETESDNLINRKVFDIPDATCFAPPFFQPCTFGTTESANIDNAELEGIEAELHYDSDRFFVRASYATVDGMDVSDGSDLGSLTPDRLAVNLGVKVPEWRARFGARVQIADEFTHREADGLGGFNIVETRDGYAVLDLYSSWSPEQIEGLRFDIGVDNVFDEEYERVFEGVAEPGRNVKIVASYQFGR
ncbi:MAG: TonB-dependent hemoglobin/transferrin/lactoferrin family receptor [Pseudomonadota bacterium]